MPRLNASVQLPKDITRMTSGLIAFRWWKEVPMLKSRTHFEQVPLATVRKIIKEQLQREARTSDAIEEERPETAFAAVEEPSTAELAAFLARRDRDDS